MDCARLCPRCGLDSEHTQKGRLPPWEVAKAFAFHTVIAAVCGHLGQTPPELLGKSNDAYIAEQLTLVSGGHPSERTVRATVVRCRSPSYYPGQPRRDGAGRRAVWLRPTLIQLSTKLNQHSTSTQPPLDHNNTDPPLTHRSATPRLQDGRVEGNLNLSRAIGDLLYKRNMEVTPEEQMITALPDVKSIDLR